MIIRPKSTLYLCKNVELDPNYNYTIDFNNINDQLSYFDDKLANKLEANTGYSFIKDTETIKVQAYIEDLFGVNYLFFNNGNKTYYAFILNKEYISNTCTKIYFKIDVLQSFMFDYELDECFIEREHQDRYIKVDNKLLPKFNIEAENLEAGTDYDISNKEKLKDNDKAPNNMVWVAVISSKKISSGNWESNNPTTFKYINQQLYQKEQNTGYYVYLAPHILGTDSFVGTPFYTYTATGDIVRIDSLEAYTASTAIMAIRVLHYSPIKYDIEPYSNGYLLKFKGGYTETPPSSFYNISMGVVLANSTDWGGLNLSSTGIATLNLYEIKADTANEELTKKLSLELKDNDLNINNLKDINNETKLMTSPYNFKQISDYQSQPLVVKNEALTAEDKAIKVIQNYGVLSKLKVYVDNYNGDNGKHYNTINSTISELPLTNSAYINYISQNKASATTGVAINIGTTVATTAIGIATGGVGFALAGIQAINLASQIANQMTKIQDLKNTPDSIRQAGNNAEFDILDENFNLEISTYSIKEPYKEKLFNYFYHYGYKCTNFKKPNIKSRYYFNYIKTIGSNIKTNIDAEFKNEIANIYDNGVTIWHHRTANTFKGVNNYDYENVELSLMEV